MDNVDGLAFDLSEGVATVTLNRPEKLNAIRWSMIHGITDWVAELGQDPDVRVIVITGAGRAFSSGDDIVGGMGDATMADELARDPVQRIGRMVDRGPRYQMIKTLMATPKPIVAALNGRTHGAGWVTALASDFRVSRDDAPIGDIRSGKAIFANQGVGLMLRHLIGASRALDLLVTGRVIDAAEAERIGIFSGFGRLRIGTRSSRRSCMSWKPTVVHASWKASVNRGILLELDGYTDHENLLNVALLGTSDLGAI